MSCTSPMSASTACNFLSDILPGIVFSVSINARSPAESLLEKSPPFENGVKVRAEQNWFQIFLTVQNVTTSYSQNLLKYYCCELATATTTSTTAKTQASRAQNSYSYS